MRYLLQLIATTACALWFGGIVTTFVLGLRFFKVLPHETAAMAANSMFVYFGKYQLILAGVAVLATGVWLVTYPSLRVVLMLAAIVAAGSLGIIGGVGITPRMDQLRQQGLSGGEEFKRLHGRSMMIASTETIILLIQGGLLVWAMQSNAVLPSLREDHAQLAA